MPSLALRVRMRGAIRVGGRFFRSQRALYAHLRQLLQQTRRPRILVVGDVMLDRYLWGEVERISPEAPIPILKAVHADERLGGAGSVVTLLRALEVDAVLATVVADDAEGRRVRELLEQQHAAADCTLADGGRSTTIKERFLGRTHNRHPQQILRVDRECAAPIRANLAVRLLAAVDRRLPETDAVLVSDYGKGICAGEIVAELAARGRRAGVPVLVDPARGADYRRYRGSTAIKPNRTEAATALNRTIGTPDEGLEAARQLLAFGVDSAVVTLDGDGIAWCDRDGRGGLFAVKPRQVCDITGAGDMVLAALGYSLAAGADWPMAIELANLAAGLEVERLGVTPLSRRELLAELAGGFSTGHKIVGLEQLDAELRERRRKGHRIVMTNGCFDLLHPGHVASLQYARSQGDCLVVGLNSDRSVELLKGPRRPVISQQDRAEMLAALACVDYVVIFDDASVDALVRRVAPDVLVKSGQYAPEEVVGHESVRRRGGTVALAPMKGDYSTRGLIQRIQQLDGQADEVSGEGVSGFGK